MKRFICNLLLVSLLNQTTFIIFNVHFIALNKLHELGLRAPESTELCHALRQQGIDLQEACLNEEECAKILGEVFGNTFPGK